MAATASEGGSKRGLGRYPDEDRLESSFAAIDLGSEQRLYVTERLIPYLRDLEDGAHDSRIAHYALRIPAIVIATMVPALIAADLGARGRFVAAALGVVVAATAAIDQFLNTGERWRHYRGTVERLKSEAWLFIERADPIYQGASSHREAFAVFAALAERELKVESSRYVTHVVAERASRGAAAATPGDVSSER